MQWTVLILLEPSNDNGGKLQDVYESGNRKSQIDIVQQ